MKKSILFILFSVTMLLFLTSVSATQVISGTFSTTKTVTATNYASIKSCWDTANYESGSCSYLYACYVVIEKGVTDLNYALLKECRDITMNPSLGTVFNINFPVPKGKIYALTTFITELKYVYSASTSSWATPTTIIPSDYRSAEQLISICNEGYLLRNNLCYKAQAVCLNTLATNLCDNPYDLYLLDYGNGFEMNIVSHYCADRNKDGVCDTTESFTCSDTNLNGVCDSDDIKVQGVACVDANKNYVCDNVESQGVFCRTNYNPVYVGTGTACVTYPNACFAVGAGKTTYTNGTCSAIYTNLCSVNADCPSMCSGVTGICKNVGQGNFCEYSGECNPRIIQCSTDASCPQPYCTGVAAQCNTATNTCTYAGRCITQPNAPSNIWARLATIWNTFMVWLSSIFT
jgi:hypothetical protein